MPGLEQGPQNQIERKVLAEAEKWQIQSQGLHTAVVAQNELLNEFRRLGLADVVREEAGREIPPILFYNEKYGWHIANLKHSMLAGGIYLDEDKEYPNKSNSPWSVEVFNPRVDDYGDWDLSLRIRALRPIPVKTPKTYLHRVVQIILDPKLNFTATGRKTFTYSLLEPDELILEAAKRGLREAFRRPKVDRGRLVSACANLDHHGGIAT